MEGVTLERIAQWTGGKLMHADPTTLVRGVSIDSRRVKSGDLFVALKGERTDGHAFIPQAIRQGASAVLCQRPVKGLPAVRVRDPRAALGRLAGHYRRQWRRLQVAAVTGSSGKTTTKEMLAAILRSQGPVLESQGNFNNDLGVPLNLARLDASHRWAVLELGMSAPGEIRALAAICQPRVGIITHIGDAHAAHFKDRAAVARSKAELLTGLVPGGWAILNADDPYLMRRAKVRPHTLLFGMHPRAQVQILRSSVHWDRTEVALRYRGRRVKVHVRALGHHQAWNAAAAVAASVALGVPFTRAAHALSKDYRPQAAMRLQVVHWQGHRVINDAYNSNPQSAAAAVRLLAELPVRGKKWFVCGSMLELGKLSLAAHQELGHQAAAAGVDGLIAVGPEARTTARTARAAGVPWVASVATAAQAAMRLRPRLSAAHDLILIKGSRGIGLEAVLRAWQTTPRR